MPTITICADDFGQNAEICQGILDLAEKQRIMATSCMTTEAAFAEFADVLKSKHDSLQIGFHFNLTHGTPLSKAMQSRFPGGFPSVEVLYKECSAKRILPQWVTAELAAQLQAFVNALKFMPDFIDGHQHVHHFPVVRQAFLQFYQKHFMEKKPPIRISANSLLRSLTNWKALKIGLSGAWLLRDLCKRIGIPHNNNFAGIYDFDPKSDYRELFNTFLKQVKNDGIIMCHPALPSKDETDPIRDARAGEYRYFSSNEFIQDWQAHAEG